MSSPADGRPARVALIYICTGPYVAFWPGFHDSFETHFLPESEVHYFVFTDATQLPGDSGDSGAPDERVHVVPQEALAWPYSTLMRYSMMLTVADELRRFEHVFFMNANMACARAVCAEEALPRPERGESLVLVQHPGFIGTDPREYTYDRNPASLAYVPEGEGSTYVCGGVNGGTSAAYLALAEELDRRIRDDLARGVVATWHDESHLNRYVIGRDDYRLLGPEFCHPDGSGLELEPVLRLRQKDLYIDEGTVKGWPIPDNRSWVSRVKSRAPTLSGARRGRRESEDRR